jgi:glycosyltransferase involved in cell wall biosynthesis
MGVKVTIITATRHRPDTLRRCIQAIQKMDVDYYEHIIVADDCPYARHVYAEFKDDAHIQFFEVEEEHRRNQGALSKNMGIKKARGTHICYCDDDNYLLPNHVRLLYTNMINQNADIGYSKMHRLQHDLVANGTHRQICFRKYLDIEGSLLEQVHSGVGPYNDMLCCMHTKDIIMKADEGEGCWSPYYLSNMHEDRELMIRFTRYNPKTIYVNEYTSVYNTHGGQANGDNEYSNQLKNLNKNQIYVFEDLLGFME